MLRFITLLWIAVIPLMAVWNTEYVDEAVSYDASQERSGYVAFDSHNNPHIVYGHDKLVHKYFDGTQWHREIVDNSAADVGDFAAIAIDNNDKIHISYQDSHHNLKYATNASGVWVTQYVEQAYYHEDWSTGLPYYTKAVGKYNSIAIDSNGHVHISYYCEDYGDLKYATNATGDWEQSTVDATGDVGQYTSIAIDSSDNAHISYYDVTNGKLKYAMQYLGGWAITSIDGDTDSVGKYTSLALDQNNYAHISYTDSTNGDLKYTTNTSGDWNSTTIDDVGSVGYYSSLALDTNGKVHISYFYSNQSDLKYATNATPSGDWSTETVLSEGAVGYNTSMALDHNNHLFIGYIEYNHSNGNVHSLHYASKITGNWTFGLIEEFGSVGGYSSIAVDSLGKLHISYYDYTKDDLKYATNASGTWVTSAVDSVGDVGNYGALAVDIDNKIHIAYWDQGNRSLKYATNKTGSWVLSTIDSDTSPESISLAVDSSRTVYFVYQSDSDHSIKYTTLESSGAKSMTTLPYTAFISSFALDKNGKSHIAFIDKTTDYLRCLSNQSGTWEVEDLNPGVYINDISIAVDTNNKAHIASYVSYPSDILQYITNISGSWKTFDIEEGYADYPSITVDETNKPHIAFKTLNGLKYASNRMGAWKTEVADPQLGSGKYASIVTTGNRVYISHQISSDQDLKLADKTLPTQIVPIINYLLN